MDQDEQAIRAVVATWMDATAAGDVSRVLELMADDVVFLGPGRPPMRGKAEFAAAMRSMEGRMEPAADIQEVRVFGDWAYCWNQLTVTIRQSGGGPPHQLIGPTLSIFRKDPGGAWVIVRDANMITPASAPPSDTKPGKSASRFRRMRPHDWDVLQYRHLDHHLRQFGV